MRHALRLLPVLALLCASSARAASFVYDAGATVAIPKSDYQVNPAISASQKIVAADWNQLGQAVYDERTALLRGYFHGLAPQTAPPPPPDAGVLLFDWLVDGGGQSGGLWAEYQDAGTQQVFDGNQQVDHLWIRGDLAVDGGLALAGKATSDSLYVRGATTLDGGVDVGAGASITSAKNITGPVASGPSAVGMAVTSQVTDGSGHTGIVFNTANTLTSGATLYAFNNGGSNKAYIDANGNLFSANAQGSFDTTFFSGFMPLASLGTNVDFASFSDQNPRGAPTFHVMSVVNVVAGTGGTTFTLALRDDSASTNLCTLNVSCASGAGAVTTSSDCGQTPGGTNHVFSFRVTVSTCTTLPTFNVSESLTHP